MCSTDCPFHKEICLFVYVAFILWITVLCHPACALRSTVLVMVVVVESSSWKRWRVSKLLQPCLWRARNSWWYPVEHRSGSDQGVLLESSKLYRQVKDRRVVWTRLYIFTPSKSDEIELLLKTATQTEIPHVVSALPTSLVVLWLKSWGETEIPLLAAGLDILVTCHQSNTSHEKDMINVRFSASCKTLSEWEQLCCMMRIGTDKLDWAAFDASKLWIF